MFKISEILGKDIQNLYFLRAMNIIMTKKEDT